ncbi:alpha/beta hydrolase [Amycolatopsis rubida]|uniref:Alpha/beta hydrolase n=1 Tax=Amycolatopsis rubida TaxID=112413 RepID=A0ABX0BNC4_9PSEU|nr:alpha/beta hydrolase [Amycolatopsis rubida]MYW91423.1 alpha/beta fold hydrolase [Amycolatopsis rubida]NEC56408.1 alpha/beta hydrolase [Amycolatopsis rubida]
MHYVEHGSGTPVLAVHGWTPDHRLMTGCLEPVFARRPGFRRIYPDLPGMGESPAGSARGSDDLLAGLEGLVDDLLGDEPFLLAGESYGGYLARGLTRARPAQVAGLALVCPLSRPVPVLERDVPDHEVLRADPELLAGLDPAEAAEYGEVAVVQSAQTLARFRADVAPGLAAADRAALQRMLAGWRLSVDPESGPAYRKPALIVCGRQDASTGFAESYGLLGHYPRASYAVLDRAGHNLQFEQPVLFEALLEEWLDRVAEGSDAVK